MKTAFLTCLLVLSLYWPVRSRACSCAWAGPFLTVAPRAELVIRAKVTGYHGRSRGIDLAMDVEALEVLKGATKAKKIRIWGDNGAQCRPYVSAFPPQTEWIFAISRLAAEEGRRGEYYINGCGEYWARVENGRVVGRLSFPHPPSVSDKPESMSLEQLRQKLKIP